MFIDEKTRNKIYADLNSSVSWRTLRGFDLLPCFLEVIKDTPEHTQITATIPSYVWEDENAKWWNEEGDAIVQELYEVLDKYAPEGYYFGAHIGNGSDFGYWITEEYEAQIENIKQIIQSNRACECCEIDNYIDHLSAIDKPVSETDILDSFDSWQEEQEIEYEKIQDNNYWASL